MMKQWMAEVRVAVSTESMARNSTTNYRGHNRGVKIPAGNLIGMALNMIFVF